MTSIKVHFELGTTLVDKISGFKGVATGRNQFLTGCDQYLLTPRGLKEGEPNKPQWFDAVRLEADRAFVKMELTNTGDKPGGESAPTSRAL